eukprot:gene3877-7091_t
MNNLLEVMRSHEVAFAGADLTVEKSHGYFFAMRIPPNKDILSFLQNFIKEKNITAASIASCSGSVKVLSLRFANRSNSTIIPEFHEITSLSGTLSIFGTHLHMSAANNRGTTIGGHMMTGNIVYTTVEVVILVLPEVDFLRKKCEVSTYNELYVQKRK